MTQFSYAQIIKTFLLVFVCSLRVEAQLQHDKEPLKLWYVSPAKDWNEALPIGNGKLGAMIFGGVTTERIQMNEESVWAGSPVDFVNPEAKKSLPEVRRLLFAGKYFEAQQLAQAKLMGEKKQMSAYQTLGDLHLTFSHKEVSISNYHRELSLDSAIALVSYRSGNVNFRREAFCNAPDNTMVLRISADKRASVSFQASLTRAGDKATFRAVGQELIMYEHVNNGNGVKLVSRLKIVNSNGNVTAIENGFKVDGADEVIIFLTAATNYRGKDPYRHSAEYIEKAGAKPYRQLKAEHVNDYQKYFKRVDLNLGSSQSVYFPTDQRLNALQRGASDPQLLELYYQFGRYLLISSSRPGGLPANLQGIWADGLNPPWDADYHININIQMNYWPAETTNLSEMHLPFLEFLSMLRFDGRKTAREMYGMEGAVAHFTTDAWLFTEPYGQTQWAMWPMGLAWCAQHAWEHFSFQNDLKFLNATGYPVMKDAATFCLNWLTEDPKTKHLVSGPSISPENTFKTSSDEVATMVMGPTMDHMIIRELFRNTIEASKVLNKDVALRKKLEQALARLAPTKITSEGRIMEWTEEFAEPEPGHRHISHLYGLYPGHEITAATNNELLHAARKTIDYRLSHGGGHTGWSRAWIINFFARLQNGEEAYNNLRALLSKSTLPNLFDNHPPFQIDGNFGATAGITEMLLQSHAGEISLLPALPAEWKDGYIKGVRARGGFELQIEWNNSTVTKVHVISKEGKQCNLRYGTAVKSFDTKAGDTYVLNGNLEFIR